MIILRFNYHPGSFKHSFLEPSESLFIPASVISIGIILITIAQYAVPETGTWLQTTFKVLFWIYAMLALLSSCCIYLILYALCHDPKCHARLSSNISLTLMPLCQMVYARVLSEKYDSYLGLPRIPSLNHSTASSRPYRFRPFLSRDPSNLLPNDNSGCPLPPRHRVLRVRYHLQRIPLPPHDPRTSLAATPA